MKYKLALYAAVTIIAITFSITWAVLQWGECRDMGHSTFYCVGHVAR